MPRATYRRLASVFFCVLLFSLASVAPAASEDSGSAFPQGVAVGDVRPDAATFWTRIGALGGTGGTPVADPAIENAGLRLEIEPGGIVREIDPASVGVDGTITLQVGGLAPDTAHRYRFVLDWPDTARDTARDTGSEIVEGTFRTPPQGGVERAVTFVVGGDVGGQAFCRHRERGYAVFRAALDAGADAAGADAAGAGAGSPPDFFIANGDMIYADGICPAEGPGGFPNLPGDFPSIADVDWAGDQVLETFLAHWRYNRADPHSRAFFASVPVYVQWDDHEVINDFGAPWARWPVAPERLGYSRMVELGRDALFAWNPISEHPEEPRRLYRSFRWGAHVELFLLDARSYRSRNDLADEPGAGKTLLGEAQRRWLLDGLVRSNATWKIVSSDVPLSIPTGWPAERYGRDAFATGDGDGFETRTGAERELRTILETLDRENVRNVVVVATDIHFAAFLRYRIDLDGDGDPLLLHELLSGPMNAGTATPRAPDPTFRPDVLYMGGQFFNFARVNVDADGRLAAEIRDENGEVRFGSRLVLEPEADP